MKSERRRKIAQQRKWAKYLSKKQNGRCHYCNVKFVKGDAFRHPSFDHVIASSHGGDHSIENGVAACRDCNSRKGSMSYSEFRQGLASCQ